MVTKALKETKTSQAKRIKLLEQALLSVLAVVCVNIFSPCLGRKPPRETKSW